MKKKNAFTLAEVLITLGIIGIVAAMTMPAIITSTREKEAVAKLKKVHSTLENAYRLAKNEHSDIENWFTTNDKTTNSEIFFNNLKPYLKILRECGFEEGCLTSGYVKTLDGRNYVNYDTYADEYRFILADGTALMIMLSSPDCVRNETVDGNDIIWQACGNIKVDIDGKKGQYTLGKDFFIFDITPKGIIPAGLANSTAYKFEDYCNASKKTNANGRSCTAWVIYNENMDYLHCNDLSWDGKTKCK